jgi:suppressor of G2 allele of SKP1
MANQAALGLKALNSSDYPLAITHYTSALAELPTSPDYYIKRSTAHQRLSDFSSALSDAEIAVVAATRRARRELIAQAQLRRAIALFSLERYADARFLFDLVESLGLKDNSLLIYKSKVDSKLKDLPDGDARKVVAIKQVPDVEIPIPEKQTTSTAAPKEKEAKSLESAEKAASLPVLSRIKHDWYQSNDKITINVLARNAPKDRTKINIQPTSVCAPLSPAYNPSTDAAS